MLKKVKNSIQIEFFTISIWFSFTIIYWKLLILIISYFSIDLRKMFQSAENRLPLNTDGLLLYYPHSTVATHIKAIRTLQLQITLRKFKLVTEIHQTICSTSRDAIHPRNSITRSMKNQFRRNDGSNPESHMKQPLCSSIFERTARYSVTGETHWLA